MIGDGDNKIDKDMSHGFQFINYFGKIIFVCSDITKVFSAMEVQQQVMFMRSQMNLGAIGAE